MHGVKEKHSVDGLEIHDEYIDLHFYLEQLMRRCKRLEKSKPMIYENEMDTSTAMFGKIKDTHKKNNCFMSRLVEFLLKSIVAKHYLRANYFKKE